LDISHAIAWLAREHDARVEGSGAVGVAAALSGAAIEGPVAIIVSGGNIDAAVLAGLLAEVRPRAPRRPRRRTNPLHPLEPADTSPADPLATAALKPTTFVPIVPAKARSVRLRVAQEEYSV